MLRNTGLATYTTVPLSAGLLVDVSRYFEALRAFRDGDAGPIAHSFADASRYAATSGRALVDALADQLEGSRQNPRRQVGFEGVGASPSPDRAADRQQPVPHP